MNNLTNFKKKLWDKFYIHHRILAMPCQDFKSACSPDMFSYSEHFETTVGCLSKEQLWIIFDKSIFQKMLKNGGENVGAPLPLPTGILAVWPANLPTAHHAHHPMPRQHPPKLGLPWLVVRMSVTMMCQRVYF